MIGHYLTVIAFAMIIVAANRFYFIRLPKIKNGNNRDIKKLTLGFAQSGIVLSITGILVSYFERSRITEDDTYKLLYVFMGIVATSTMLEVYLRYKNRLRH